MPEDTFVDLDALDRETNHEPYRFTFGGKVRELPHLSDLTFEQLLRIDFDPQDVLAEVTKESDPPLAGEILKAKGHVVEALFANWRKHGGIKPGESPASTDS